MIKSGARKLKNLWPEKAKHSIYRDRYDEMANICRSGPVAEVTLVAILFLVVLLLPRSVAILSSGSDLQPTTESSSSNQRSFFISLLGQ